uniref:Phosphoglycerate mutase n=1 Tax=Helicotheca tamesis TaxID=374047 RepID=A0A7S2H5Z5_9STRA
MSVVTERAQRFAASLPDLPRPRRRVYLLRHGMTDWNKRGFVQGSGFDIPLNDEGRSQARYAAEELSALPIGVIASSHLSRASKTADAVHTFHPLAARFTFEGFGEISYGDLEGKCIHADNEESRRLKNQFDKVSLGMEKDVRVGYPGGENAHQVEKRARKALMKLIDDCPDARHMVIVGHGRMNKIILASLLYGDASKFSPIQQGNTAISIVDYDPEDDNWTEVMLNYCAHTEDRGAASGGRY